MAILFKNTSDAMAKQLYAEEVYREISKETWLNSMTGGPDSLIWLKTDFSKQQGYKVNFTQLTNSSDDNDEGWVENEATLEGKEEQLSDNPDSVEITLYRTGVSQGTPYTNQIIAWSVEDETDYRLKEKLKTKLERLHFNAFANTTYISYANDTANTSDDDIVAGDTLTLDMITDCAARARIGKSDNSQWRIKPAKLNPGDPPGYLFIVSVEQMANLQKSSDYKTANINAQKRAADNPIFSGADTVYWNGNIIKSSEYIVKTTNATSVPISKALLIGASGLCRIDGKRPEILTRTADFNKQFISLQFFMGVKAPVFDSKWFGSLSLHTAHTAL